MFVVEISQGAVRNSIANESGFSVGLRSLGSGLGLVFTVSGGKMSMKMDLTSHRACESNSRF